MERKAAVRSTGGRPAPIPIRKGQVPRAAIFQTLRRIGHHRRVVRRRLHSGRGQRRLVRVRTGSGANRGTRRLRSQHHHSRPCTRGRAHRRVRSSAPRHHRLRRHPRGAAPGDHRVRGQRVLRAQRRQHPRHRSRRDPGCAARRAVQRGEHADHAARAQRRGRRRGSGPGEGVAAEAARGVLRNPSREALHEARDPRPLRQPGLARHGHPRRGRRRGGGAAPLRQVGPRRRAR